MKKDKLTQEQPSLNPIEQLRLSNAEYQDTLSKEINQRSQIQDALKKQITELFEGSLKENLLCELLNPYSFGRIISEIEKKLNSRAQSSSELETDEIQVVSEPSEVSQAVSVNSESSEPTQTTQARPELPANSDLDQDLEVSSQPQELPTEQAELENTELEPITLQKFRQNLFRYMYDTNAAYSQDRLTLETVEAKREYIKPVKVSALYAGNRLPVEFEQEDFSFSEFLRSESSLKGVCISSTTDITEDTTLIFYPNFYNDIVNTSGNITRTANKKSDSAIAAVTLRSVTKTDLSIQISILKDFFLSSDEFTELFEIEYQRGSLELSPTSTLEAMLTMPAPAPVQTQEQSNNTEILESITSDTTELEDNQLITTNGSTSLDQLSQDDLNKLNKYKV